MQHQQALQFGVLNYEKQHKEGTCKVLGRSVVFSAFYADFCLCPKLVIITTFNVTRSKRSPRVATEAKYDRPSMQEAKSVGLVYTTPRENLGLH